MRRSVGVLVSLLLVAALSGMASAATITSTWSVGKEPFGVTIDARDGMVYVSNSGHTASSGGSLSVVDPATVASSPILLPAAPLMSALDTGLDRLFVVMDDGTLGILDLPTRSLVGTAPAGGPSLALDPATHRVYVSAVTSGLAMIDGQSGAVLARAQAAPGDNWWAVALDASRHRVYVTNLNFDAPSVVVLDDRDLSPIANVGLPAVPRLALAVDPGRGLVYVGGFSSGTDPFGRLYAIDETSLQIVRTLDVGAGEASPFSMTLAPGANALYVSNLTMQGPGNGIVVVDTSTFSVADRIPLDFQPGQSAMHPDGRLYVSGYDSAALVALTLGAPSDVAPVVDAVSVDPAAPLTNDTIRAVVQAHDVDGDALTFAYQWYRDGVLLGTETGATLDLSKPGNGDRGDWIAVVVTAFDGQLSSAITTRSSWAVQVGDTAPSAAVTLNSTAPRTNDVVTALPAGSDVDGDTLTYTFTWKVDGLVRRVATGGVAGDTFDLSLAGNGDRGDVVSVDVVASDGSLLSATASAKATVVDAPPAITVSLDDVTPKKQDVLVATAVGADPDADALTYTYAWRVNGKLKQTTISTSATSSAFDLKAAEAEVGDVVTVDVVASDGSLTASATANATVTPAGH